MRSDTALEPPPDSEDWVALTSLELPGSSALEWVGRGSCGAVVGFLGVVRDHAEGRQGVSAIDYEAYEEQVVPRLSELAAAARLRLPEIGRIVIWHRVGRLSVGEASVAVVVSTPHRAEAFEASRFLIDTLKETVPIWKHEHWEAGSDWSTSAHPIRLPSEVEP